MRILHTADWHLGRLFYGTYLTEDQAFVLEQQFLQILKDEKIDIIVNAGDVFDRSVPPAEAVELWDSIITKVALDFNIPMIAIGGNHDGMERLEVGSKLLERSGLHIVTQVKNGLKPIAFSDKWGTIDFYPLPFSEPQGICHELAKHIHDNTFSNTVTYHEAYQSWIDFAKHYGHSERSVAISHVFVAGGTSSESERPLSVGGLDNVAPFAYRDFNYTALGHLHGPQRVGADHIRYSGSLLKYSFDESSQQKSFTVVDIDAKGHVDINYIPILAKRDVKVISGKFDELIADIELQNSCRDDYLLIQLEDTIPIIDAMARLRQRYPYVMTLELVGRMAQTVATTNGVRNYKNLSEEALFNQFAEEAWKHPLSEKEREYMKSLWNRIIKEEM